jgi:hypothetical protein
MSVDACATDNSVSTSRIFASACTLSVARSVSSERSSRVFRTESLRSVETFSSFDCCAEMTLSRRSSPMVVSLSSSSSFYRSVLESELSDCAMRSSASSSRIRSSLGSLSLARERALRLPQIDARIHPNRNAPPTARINSFGSSTNIAL